MKKRTKVFVSTLLTLTILGGAAAIGVSCYSKTYERAADTACTILQITDVHMLNDEKKDAKALKTIRAMVETTKPDLIVVTGDVTSEKENFTAFKTFGSFMESFAIPWAFTFGNHEGLDIAYGENEGPDGETIADKQTLSDYLESLPHCIYERGDPSVDGMGNYTHMVRDETGKALMALVFMDSHSYYPDEAVGGYDCFHPNQIAWYEETIKTIARQENGDESQPVPSLAFFHVPMREFAAGYDTGERVWGRRLETEGASFVDDEMFETMVALGSTKGVFVGHDHMNNYTVNYQGIQLSYGLSCDHNIYVVPFRGGNLINIKEDGSFTTQALIRHRGQSSITVCKER